MKFSYLLLASLIGLTIHCTKMDYQSAVQNPDLTIELNKKHPLLDSLTHIADHHTAHGVPGIQILALDKDGWCGVSSGYSKIETEEKMSIHMTSWIYSITKIYTATMVMKQHELGILHLDTSIHHYLPEKIRNLLPRDEKITVRMLLNHSSGLKNFTVTFEYQLAQFNTPLVQPDLYKKLDFVDGKKLKFKPGTDFYYSNTNYILLQFILEHTSGKNYKELLKEYVLAPLDLKNTFYDIPDSEIIKHGCPNFYFERYNNGQLENITTWHNAIGQSLKGYGGIIAHGQDVIRFYSALLRGQLVSHTSVAEMKKWITASGHEEPDYGLGLEYYEYIKGIGCFGHEGDNLGGTTQIVYIPSNDVFAFISINVGRQIYGQYIGKASSPKIDICKYLSKQ